MPSPWIPRSPRPPASDTDLERVLAEIRRVADSQERIEERLRALSGLTNLTCRLDEPPQLQEPEGQKSLQVLPEESDPDRGGTVASGMLGEWVDPEGEFQEGKTIVISAETWYPKSSAQDGDGKLTSRFAYEEITPEQMKLVEWHDGGEVSRFLARPSFCLGDSDRALEMEQEGTTQHWRLVPAAAPGTEPPRMGYLRSVDTQTYDKEKIKAKRGKVLDIFVALTIGVNSIMMGVESQLVSDSDTPAVFVVMEQVFLAIYILELALRFHLFGFKIIRRPLVIVDVALVMLGVVVSWIISPLQLSSSNTAHFAGTLMVFRMVRVMRLLRLLKSVRQLPIFALAWKLVLGIVTCSNTVLATMLLIAALLYAFSILAYEMFNRTLIFEGDEALDTIDTYFSSLPQTMLTLFRFVTGDGAADIYTPLVEENLWLGFFFIPLLALLNILAMNLVTAVIVETAFDEAQKDRRKVRRQRQGLLKKLVPDIQRLFHTMDKDGSGVLTRADLQDYDMIDVPDSLVSYLRIDNMEAIFELFDEDENDSITQQEFLEGFSYLVLSDSNMPPEAMVTFKMMKSTKRLTEEVHRWLRDQRR